MKKRLKHYLLGGSILMAFFFGMSFPGNAWAGDGKGGGYSYRYDSGDRYQPYDRYGRDYYYDDLGRDREISDQIFWDQDARARDYYSRNTYNRDNEARARDFYYWNQDTRMEDYYWWTRDDGRLNDRYYDNNYYPGRYYDDSKRRDYDYDYAGRYYDNYDGRYDERNYSFNDRYWRDGK